MSATHGHTALMQELLQWIDKRAVPSYNLRTGEIDVENRFVPIESADTYLQELNYTRTRQLLTAVFPDGDRPPAKDLATTCPRIFCILADMKMPGAVKYIGTFVRYPMLWDERLPFEEKPNRFPMVPGDDKDEFWEEFRVKQWKFCAPKLKALSAHCFDDHCILPLTELRGAGTGGGEATVYRATVSRTHDKLMEPELPKPGNIYAIKSFKSRSGLAKEYERELKAFKLITESGTREARGIIGFYGSFEYCKTFNLVLEFADGGTLEEFLENNPKPPAGLDAIEFWKSLFATLDAIFRIHQKSLHPHEGKIGQLLQGWHLDLKPKNILVVKSGPSPYKWLFKIADFGEAHFKTIMIGQQHVSSLNASSTKTYGAPECYAMFDATANKKSIITQSVDIWSLGGIYSEVAVWAVEGYEAVKRYRRNRKHETDKYSDFRDGDCFHNGKARLNIVDEQHATVKRGLPQWDFITGKVLDNMIIEMLDFKPGNRPSAEQLIGKAERLINDAQDALRQSTVGTPLQRIRSPIPSPPQSPESAARHPTTDFVSRPSGEYDSQFGISGGHYTASPQATMNPVISDFVYMPILGSMNQQTVSHLSPIESSQGGHDYGEMQTVDGEPQRHVNNGSTTQSQIAETPQEEQPTPYCSVAEAKEWHDKMKYGQKDAKLPFQDELIWQLEDRDHVFVIDDSRSMKEYWKQVEELVLILAYITKKKDPNKLELYFLSSNKPYKFGTSSNLVEAVKKHPVDKMTNLNTLLDFDLQKYRDAIDQSRKRASLFGKKTVLSERSIYILTDGVWRAGTDDQGHHAIKAMTEKLSEHKYPRSQIGIQLIRFGNDEGGLRRMRTLDRLSQFLGLENDIVDTEPCDGNVWKMLLGSINPLFDDDAELPERPSTSAT